MDEYRVPSKIISQRLRRAVNFVVEGDEDLKESVTNIPGMSFTHFTRAGTPTAFSIGRLVEMNVPIFKVLTTEYLAKQDLQVVVIGETLNVLPAYHQRARIVFPMRVHGRLVHVGNSSFTAENAVKDAQFGDDLITARRSFVLMNMKTRKAEKLVGDIRQKIESTVYNGIKNEFHPILGNFPKKPLKCFELSVHVRHSDTDTLYHSNHASYYTYCLDVATEGAKRGHFHLLKGDLLSYRLEILESLFKGESFPGDELKVSVWENQNKPSEIFSQIEKEGEIIWLGRIGFRLELESRL